MAVLWVVLLVPAYADGDDPDPTILVVGDSLSAAYGMDAGQAWPVLLETRLNGQGYGYRVVNASIAGDTTQGGRYRLPRALERFTPDIVIIELGGNDGLRGLALETTRDNLSQMIEASQAAGADVILAGMQIPPNYGEAYTEQFRSLFPGLAEEYDTALIPFFLDGVALNPDLMQDDGIHPNADAQPVLVELVWPTLSPLLVGNDKKSISEAD